MTSGGQRGAGTSIWLRNSRVQRINAPPPPTKLPPAYAENQAKVVQRAFWLLLIGSAVCVVALSGSDHQLLAADATIKIPYVGLEASVASFLVFGPTALLGLWTYLHLAYDRYQALHDPAMPLSEFHLFAIDKPAFRAVAGITFYLLVPFVLALFLWKALPRPERTMLGGALAVTCAVSFVLWFWRAWGAGKWWPMFALATLTPALALAAWMYQWPEVERYLSKLRSLDLVKADFARKDLRDTALDNAWLDGARLQDAFLQRASLRGASLRSVNLSNASLQGSDLSMAMFDNSVLEGVWAQPDRVGGGERSTRLEEAMFKGATIQGASFYKARLGGADFIASVIRRSSFKDASMTETSFVQSHIEEADFSRYRRADGDAAASEAEHSRDVNFSDARLVSVEFRDALLPGANFNRARLSQVNFYRTRLDGAHFDKSVLAPVPRPADSAARPLFETAFAQAHLRQSSFDGATIVNVSFWGAKLDQASFSAGAVLVRAVFKESDGLGSARFVGAAMCDADFSGAAEKDGAAALAMNGTDFSRSLLQRVRFKHVDLSNARFAGATLEEVDFTGARLDGAQFQGARLKAVKFPAGFGPAGACGEARDRKAVLRLPRCKGRPASADLSADAGYKEHCTAVQSRGRYVLF